MTRAIGLACIGFDPFEAGRLRNLIEMSKRLARRRAAPKLVGEIGGYFDQMIEEMLDASS